MSFFFFINDGRGKIFGNYFVVWMVSIFVIYFFGVRFIGLIKMYLIESRLFEILEKRCLFVVFLLLFIFEEKFLMEDKLL